MPCIWGQHNNSQIFCAVMIFPASTLLPRGGGNLPAVPGALNALIDTGATTTGISNQVVTQLQLQPVGKVPIHGVGGVQHHNSYLFRVGFPFLIPPGSPLAAGLPPLAPGQQHTQVHVLEKVTCSPTFIQSEQESVVELNLPPTLDHLAAENSGFIARPAGRGCGSRDEAPQALRCRGRCADAPHYSLYAKPRMFGTPRRGS